MKKFKFTQEVKDNWLENLKSGKYVQGQGSLFQIEDGVCKHCCLGVLANIYPEFFSLDEDSITDSNDTYCIMETEILSEFVNELILANDKGDPDNYASAIQIIEKLQVNK